MNPENFHELNPEEISELVESLRKVAEMLDLEAARRRSPVWITRTGSRYHRTPVCKGLNSASSLTKVSRSWAAGTYRLRACDDCA